jgi:hypothetical protein
MDILFIKNGVKMDKITNLWEYLCDANNWCEPQDRTFYTLFLIWVLTSSYLMIGLYFYYPEVLDMLFWPISIK